ncbi:MAG: alkaline phosphatase D family protein [Ignavibacteria bacterium]|nr:alkaline phosphatase D family protein [Ignavibacteria bacterium]
MIRLSTLLIVFGVSVIGMNQQLWGQLPLPPTQEIEVEIPKADERNVVNYTRPFASANHQTMNFDSKLKPFYHGVASGDPLHDRVILWTRVTPDTDGDITVQWKIATDTALANVIQSGTTTTNQTLDYTVKIDALGLQPNTTYYYGFEALGKKSLTGRTRTTPVDGVQQLRFAVVSCSNYQQGFFNAYGRIAERKDIDAVIHLGDYIYEYADGGYGYTKEVNRGHEPKSEVISLSDYRIRHSFYKLDPDLRLAHQQHPFIAIWDDHESANDSYKDGAENHDSTKEGSWQERKMAAENAYFEWMPIRRKTLSSNQIYRSISYGNIMDLILVDTRLEGREKQLGGKDTAGKGAIDTALWKSANRTLLGAQQQQWLFEQLQQSKATWKILANQVMMMQVEAQALGFPTNLDAWDGYPAEREKL